MPVVYIGVICLSAVVKISHLVTVIMIEGDGGGCGRVIVGGEEEE